MRFYASPLNPFTTQVAPHDMAGSNKEPPAREPVMPPEQNARRIIDKLLSKAGCQVCDANQADLFAHRGIAIREFPLKKGHGLPTT